MTVRALVVGLGSIGRRHAANLRALLGPELRLAALTRGAAPSLPPAATDDCDGGVFSDLADALATRPDVVVVSNPTSLHVPVVEAAVRSGAAVLVEKPVSDSLDELGPLLRLVSDRGATVAVGFQHRFHPALVELAGILATRGLGRLVAVDATEADHLTAYHPYEDYRESYAARRELGGGVVLTQIHELDYLHGMLGMARRVFAVGGHLSELSVDVEDTADALLEFESDGRPLPVHVHLDFCSRPARRTCSVRGESGLVEVDLLRPRLTWHGPDGDVVRSRRYEGYARNDMYLAEMRAFLAAAREGAAVPVDLAHGTDTLRIALALRRSLTTGSVETVA
ncbi:MAG: Gfo/Idh/MocA family oxidoreductase [Actinomycetota bacterium]|nr:Gfo/Idh/MocA family oxidoreductase [Actinomycetota bacterium]